MTVNELIAILAQQGIRATEAEIENLYGDVSELTEADVPSLVEMWQQAKEPEVTALAKGKRGGKLVKPNRVPPSAKTGSLQKIDANNLPEVASMSTTEITEWIERVEQSKAEGETQDNRLVQFLSDLYNHRQAAIELGRGAVAALSQQDRELQSVMADLSSTVTTSLQGLSQADSQLAEIAGGARLGDCFRKRSNLAERFHAAIGDSATQPRSEAESAA